MRRPWTGRRGRSRGDRGAATTALVVCVVVAMAALLIIAVEPLLRATEGKGRTQTGADAAALAGAVAARDTAVDELTGLSWVFRPAGLSGTSVVWRLSAATAGGAGVTSASQYASRNDASLTSYQHDAGRDRVRVGVRLAEPTGKEGVPIDADAQARVGVALATCEARAGREIIGWTEPPPEPSPTPTPTPDPTATPTPTPTPTPPPPPFVPQPIYSAWAFTFSCDGADGFSVSAPTVGTLVQRAAAELRDVRPRLVS